MKRALSTLPRLAAGAAFALAALSIAPAALADEPQDEASKQEVVTRLNAEGTAFFKAREYRKALERFSEAYKLDAEPDLLYNIARCHEALGEGDAAIEKYTRYLEQPGADAEGRSRAEDKLRALKQAQAAREAKAGGAKGGRPADGKGAEARSFSPWTWVALGVGGVAAAGGTFAFLSGAADHRKVTNAPNYGKAGQSDEPSTLTRSRAEDLVDSGDAKKRVGVVLWGVGGAALATSAVLFFLERPKPGERGATLDVTPGPGGGFLSLHGRF